MKLTNLSIPSQIQPTRRIVVTLDANLFDALSSYAEEGERSGFVREGVRLLLALTDEDDRARDGVVDHLFISCGTEQDVVSLVDRLMYVADELFARTSASLEGREQQ